MPTIEQLNERYERHLETHWTSEGEKRPVGLQWYELYPEDGGLNCPYARAGNHIMLDTTNGEPQ